jgi:hypothetical protein
MPTTLPPTGTSLSAEDQMNCERTHQATKARFR